MRTLSGPTTPASRFSFHPSLYQTNSTVAVASTSSRDTDPALKRNVNWRMHNQNPHQPFMAQRCPPSPTRARVPTTATPTAMPLSAVTCVPSYTAQQIVETSNFNDGRSLLSDADRPFRCPSCRYHAKRKGTLKRHIQAKHTGERPFQCQFCDYSATQKGTLNSHIVAKHNNGKARFQCQQDNCNYIAVKKSHLDNHMLVRHTNVRPFQCVHCTFATTQQGTLDRHIRRLHANYNPSLMCPHCPFTSTLRGDMNTHVMSAHGANSTSIVVSSSPMEQQVMSHSFPSPPPSTLSSSPLFKPSREPATNAFISKSQLGAQHAAALSLASTRRGPLAHPMAPVQALLLPPITSVAPKRRTSPRPQSGLGISRLVEFEAAIKQSQRPRTSWVPSPATPPSSPPHQTSTTTSITPSSLAPNRLPPLSFLHKAKLVTKPVISSSSSSRSPFRTAPHYVAPSSTRAFVR